MTAATGAGPEPEDLGEYAVTPASHVRVVPFVDEGTLRRHAPFDLTAAGVERGDRARGPDPGSPASPSALEGVTASYAWPFTVERAAINRKDPHLAAFALTTALFRPMLSSLHAHFLTITPNIWASGEADAVFAMHRLKPEFGRAAAASRRPMQGGVGSEASDDRNVTQCPGGVVTCHLPPITAGAP